ncbi:MAG: pitrilysin family protein [Acidobacteriota bacterium]|jgi:predicted Zn-dependent peptidase|nr:pitrilysin family protein [Acidobacteriota bacterium]
MKRLMVIACIAGMIALNLAAASGPDINKLHYPELNPIHIPPIHKAELNNGLRLRVVRTDKLPLVDIRILVNGGSVLDPADKVGLASMTAGLMRIGGTQKWTGDELDLYLDRLGINMDAQAAGDYFSVTLSCLHKDLDAAVAALAQMVRSPRFAEDKIEEMSTRLSSSIARRNDEPNGIASREFERVIYGKDSPFATVLEYAHLAAIEKADLAACHKRFFAPGNMLAGVSGPVDIAEVKAVFQRHFGDWSHQADLPDYPAVKPNPSQARVFFVEKPELNQSTIQIGHLGTLRDLEREPAQKVFNAIFSQGMSSRLFSRVRTKMGLTYGVGGGIETEERHPGKTAFFTFTKSESTIKAIRAILEEIEKIRAEEVSADELSEAKNYFINSFVFQFSTPARILNNELSREFYGLPEGYLQRTMDAIENVTAADVLAVARDFVHPDRFRILIVGNEAGLDGKLSELGQVEKIDITIPPPPMEETIPAATPESLAKGAALVKKAFDTVYKGYRDLKTLRTVADMKMSMPQGTFEVNLETITRFPDKRYTAMTIMGMKMETVINRDKGIVRRMGQSQPLPREQVEAGQFGSMHHMASHMDAYRFQILEPATVDGTTYDVVYVTPADGKDKWRKFYFNRDNGRMEIQEQLSQVPGNAGVAREINSDFRVISGIPFAFKSISKVKDKTVAEVTVKSVEVNGPVDESLFKLE